MIKEQQYKMAINSYIMALAEIYAYEDVKEKSPLSLWQVVVPKAVKEVIKLLKNLGLEQNDIEISYPVKQQFLILQDMINNLKEPVSSSDIKALQVLINQIIVNLQLGGNK